MILYIKKQIIFNIFLIAIVLVFFPSLTFASVSTGNSSNLDQLNFRWRFDDGSESAAAWRANTNTGITGISTSETSLRIRINVDAPNNRVTVAVQPRLEFSSNATSCTDGSWTIIGAQGSGSIWRLKASGNFTDGDDTTQQISADTHITGDIYDSTQTGATVTIAGNGESTEIEWSIETNGVAEGVTYRFRATENGTAFANYSQCATLGTASANQPPVVSNVVLDGGTAITLTENITTAVSATADVLDSNGADDIVSATSTIYRSVVGAGCTADDNNCYKIGTGNCSFNGATTTVTCTANIQFFADPTDASSTDYSAENWLAEITVTDSAGATGASSTLSGVELNTLWAIDVTASISYGSVNPNANTGIVNQTVTVTNTGNAAINVEASGDDMTLGGSTIGVANQKYATSTFTYLSCTVCTALSSTPTAYEVDLLKPTSAIPVTDLIYWGLLVPDGTAQGAHSGTNTFTAIGD